MRNIFITGTDTNIGKTYISCLLLDAFNELNLKTNAIKPIASGCYRDTDGRLKNKDALQLQAHANMHKPYHKINPITYEEPIAPHIAANICNKSLSLEYFK